MRPLPVEPFAGQPAFVRGIAVIRGAATPVVDLVALLTGDATATDTRFVTVRMGDRCVALAVDAVVGLARIDRSEEARLPPLLRYVGDATVKALTTLDASLLAVLDASRAVGEDVWRAGESAAT